MKTSILQNALIFLIAITLLNCKGKQGDPGPTGTNGSTGPTGPVLNGAISGFVTLTTSNGLQPANKSGVTVKTNKGDSTITDSAGAWALSEVTGIYNITFTKAGYGTTTTYGYNFSGGGTSYIATTALSQPPAFMASITLDTLTPKGSSTATKDLHMNVNFSVSAVPGQKEDMEFFVYYDTNSTVSSTNYLGLMNYAIPASQTIFQASITGADFLAAGIVSGQTVYIIAYPSSTLPATTSKYVNESTGKTIYTSLGTPSAVQSLTVPH